MPDPVLTLLKYVFLAVLYLFFLRVLRAVWVELREPKPQEAPASYPAAPGGAALPAHLAQAAGAPTIVGSVPQPVAGQPSTGPASSGSGSPGAEKLVVVAPDDQKGAEFPLGDELTVGRAGGCGILLGDDTFVSQLHARVFRHDGGLYVEDLGSTNGTYVNKKKVTSPVLIRKGDKVQFGRTTMEVQKR